MTTSDEHTVAIVSFEGALKREIKRIRKALVAATEAGVIDNRMELEIKAEGRILDGELKLSFGLGTYSASVTASSLNACVDEFLRRKGWEMANAPKALAYERIPSDDTDPSEVPNF